MVNLSHPRETDKIVPTISEKAPRQEKDASVKVYPPDNNSIRETDSLETTGDPKDNVTDAEGKYFVFPNPKWEPKKAPKNIDHTHVNHPYSSK